LMLSGIGDSEHLKQKGINVIHDLKGVGKNLQDHLETYIQQECKTTDTLYKYTQLVPKVLAGIQWFLSKSGPCSQSFLEAGGFAKSSPSRTTPNIQFHFFPSFVINHGLVNPSSHGYQLHASPNHPKSRGSIKLSSSNPYDYPKILFNYLEHEDDLKQTRESIVVARKILAQNSMVKYAGKEIGPGSDVQSDEDLDEYIKSNAETAYHPCGTLKMGVDKMAVVDENLKIHGLQNIRVVDASVMPEIPSGNLNAPTLMIAEKSSDLILNN
jgi:choline dehydrogenase